MHLAHHDDAEDDEDFHDPLLRALAAAPWAGTSPSLDAALERHRAALDERSHARSLARRGWWRAGVGSAAAVLASLAVAGSDAAVSGATVLVLVGVGALLAAQARSMLADDPDGTAASLGGEAHGHAPRRDLGQGVRLVAGRLEGPLGAQRHAGERVE